MTARHIYVDETKERDYVLVASVHLGTEANTLRKAMRSFVLRGQTRIHLAKESNSRCARSSTRSATPASPPPSTTLAGTTPPSSTPAPPASRRSSTTSKPTTRRYWFWSRTTHSCSGTSDFSTMQYTPPDSPTHCATNITAPRTNFYSLSPTRSHGAGHAAALGDSALSPQS